MLKNKDDGTYQMKKQVESFLEATMQARELSQRDRDYYDGYQWTETELNILNQRKQVPITVNRVKPKVEGLKGLLDIRKTDIKAFPRNKQDEDSAHAVTDALRYVSDNNDFESLSMESFENLIIEGYEGAAVEVAQTPRGEIEIKINRIPWDRIYFDPFSTRKDFSDARFIGQILWMDFEQLKEVFPSVKEDELISQNNSDLDGEGTFDDKPRWYVKEEDRLRVRVAQHYYIKDGKWYVCHFSGDTIISKPELSPYLDEYDQPSCPLLLQSAYIDRDNMRYGEVRAFIDMQREINHRRSKALHLLSTRQILTRTGALESPQATQVELGKPNGIIEVNADNINDAFQILPTNDFTAGQFQLYQDAKQELDATSMNAQLSGERQSGDLSGKAIDRLQSAGAMEVNSLFKAHSHWKKRIFRQVWERVRQFWTEEKWIRITDDQDNLRWVGLNTEVTVQQLLQETINDDSKPETMRKGAALMFQTMMQNQDPRLQQIVEVKNRVSELDVDVILDESIDVVNIQQEQFQILAEFAKTTQDIDIIELIELSQIRGKDDLIEKIESRRQAAAQAQDGAVQIQQQTTQVQNAKTFADAQLTTKKAEQTAIETQMLLYGQQDTNPQVIV